VTLAWPSPQRVKRVILYFAPPWHQGSAPVRFHLQTLESNTERRWTTRYSYVNTTATSEPFGDIVTGCTRETFYDGRWVFNVVFPERVETKGVQLVVEETTFGAEPDSGSYALCAGNQGSPRRLFLRSFQVYGA
jgi:hypothetical protein